jgi:hypothetical protein
MALVVCLGRAAAAEEPPAFSAPSASLHGLLGTQTPHGVLGAAFEIDPIRWLVVGVGAGLGPRVQVAGQLRGRVPLGGRWVLTGGGGLSHGHYVYEYCGSSFLEPPKCSGKKAGDVWWGNGELGVELDARPASTVGVRLRGFAGVKLPANPEDVVCLPGGGCEDGVGPIFYVGISGGISLRLTR